MRESDYKRKLVREINALPGGYARRIEDRWSVGALDMFIKLPNHPAMWAEAKVISGFLFAPTERQYIEGKQLIAAGVPAVLIGWKNGNMFVSEWTDKANLKECFWSSGNFAEILIGYLERKP